MRPTKDEDALVDLLDVILRDGAVLRADVIISVAEIPLVGIKLTAAIAGMETMTDYGLFEEWDTSRRKAAVARRQYGHRDRVSGGSGDENGNRVGVGSTPNSSSSSRRRLERGDGTEDHEDHEDEGGETDEDATISVTPPLDGVESSGVREVPEREGEQEEREREEEEQRGEQ